MNQEIKNPVEANVKELLKDSMLEKISGGTDNAETPTCGFCQTKMKQEDIEHSQIEWVCPNCGHRRSSRY